MASSVQQGQPSQAPDVRSSSLNDSSCVRMIEVVTSGHTIDGTLMGTESLLQLMDICTCAAAEKHTKVNCVTVSMGDVIFEYYPTCGDLLELTAHCVYAGNTSLDVSLVVLAEVEGGIRKLVCEAIFTYVTTRGPDGEKRICPPLEIAPENGSEQFEWEMKISQHRRNLLSVERKQGIHSVPADSLFDLEMSEVVLPRHQNHMGHTFGGVVMAWMAKSALAVATRKSKRKTGSLAVRSVLRVEFKCGSDVSDHLIFRSRLNAIFDEGRSAEIEVHVSKRSLSSGEETGMNTGYFYISGSDMGSGNDIPFSPLHNRFFKSPLTDDTMSLLQARAEWRRMQLLARRQLLGGTGNVVKWHQALKEEAPLLTIKSALRLVHYHEVDVAWTEFPASSNSIETIQWTSGQHWGRNNTFILRVKGGEIRSDASLETMIGNLRTRRSKWDNHCVSIQVLEQSNHTAEANSASSIKWDIVRHEALTPKVARRSSEVSGVEASATVPFCLLRAWQVDDSAGNAILASQSVAYDGDSDSAARVSPSGWFIDKIQGDSSRAPTIQVTYIVEHDLLPMRKVCIGMSDEEIVAMMAKIAVHWFEQLLGI